MRILHLSSRARRSAILAVVLVGSFGVATGAASAWGSCNTSGRVCLFRNTSGSVELGWRSAGGGLVNISSGNRNEMSSWKNSSGTNAAYYHGLNGGGTCRTMSANSNSNYVGDSNNDQAESWRTNRGC